MVRARNERKRKPFDRRIYLPLQLDGCRLTITPFVLSNSPLQASGSNVTPAHDGCCHSPNSYVIVEACGRLGAQDLRFHRNRVTPSAIMLMPMTGGRKRNMP